MIDIVLDTNLLKSGSTDFTIVQFITKVNDILDVIESNDWYEKVSVLIPQIVIDELFEHQKKAYYDKFASIKSCKFQLYNLYTPVTSNHLTPKKLILAQTPKVQIRLIN